MSRSISVCIPSHFLFSFLILLLVGRSQLSAQPWELIRDLPGGDVSDVWAGHGVISVVYQHYIFYTSNDRGSTWKRHDFLPQVPVVHGEDGHLATLDDALHLIVSSDGGDSWNVITSIDYRPASLSRIVSDGRAFYFLNPQLDDTWRIYRSTDSLDVWEEVTPFELQIRDAALYRGELYAATTIPGPTNTSDLYLLDSAGTTWEKIQSFPDEIRRMGIGADSLLYALGGDRQLYRSQEGRRQLEPVTMPITDFNNRAPVVTEEGEYLAIPVGFGLGGGYRHLYRISSDFVDTVAISPEVDEHVFAAFVGDSGRIWLGLEVTGWLYSDDNGETWKKFQIRGAVPVKHLQVSQEMSNGAMLVSTYFSNYIQSWDKPGEGFTEITPLPSAMIDGLGEAGVPVLLYSDHLLLAAAGYQLYASVDNGKSWTQKGSVIAGDLVRLPNGAILANADPGTGYQTSISFDTGTTWTEVPELRGVLQAVTGPPPFLSDDEAERNTFYAITSESDDLLQSTNGGISWQSVVHQPGLRYVRRLMKSLDGGVYAGTGSVWIYPYDSASYLYYHPDSLEPHWYPLPCTDTGATYDFSMDVVGRVHLVSTCGDYIEQESHAWYEFPFDLPEGTNPVQVVLQGVSRYAATDRGLYVSTFSFSVPNSSSPQQNGTSLSVSTQPGRNEVGLTIDLYGAHNNPVGSTSSQVTVDLYAINGEQILRLLNEYLSPGKHRRTVELPSEINGGAWILLLRQDGIVRDALVVPVVR